MRATTSSSSHAACSQRAQSDHAQAANKPAGHHKGEKQIANRSSSSLKNLETEAFLSLADRCSGGVFDSLRLFL